MHFAPGTPHEALEHPDFEQAVTGHMGSIPQASTKLLLDEIESLLRSFVMTL